MSWSAPGVRLHGPLHESALCYNLVLFIRQLVGGSFYGQVGTGVTAYRVNPVAVAGGIAFTRITAGSGHTCAIRQDTKGAMCWVSWGYLRLGACLERR